jgi:ribonuclease P/MRP protein subunit RPP40
MRKAKVVEINLRLPSMLHGKKGFERIVWSFKNVLKDPLTWLFCDLSSGDDGPVKKHHPITRACGAQVYRLNNLKVPVLNPPEKTLASFLDDFNDYALNMQEWLALISIESPRIRVGDKIDPFLSRYEVELDTATPEANVVRMQWKGMLPACWVARLFAVCMSVPFLGLSGACKYSEMY